MQKYLFLSILVLLFSKTCFSQISEINREARNGNLEKVISLLNNGTNINERDKENYTPLLSAAFHSQDSLTIYLIERGANLNVENNYGWTVLMSAAQNDSVETLKYFIKKGANINYISHQGLTALDKATNPKTKEFLISIGAKCGFDILNPDQSKFKKTKKGKQGYCEVKCFDGTYLGKGRYKNDLENGYWKFYNSQGFLDSEGTFKHGKRNGIWKNYFYPDDTESSKLTNIERYKLGLFDGFIKEEW